jgi:hypothetical protein
MRMDLKLGMRGKMVCCRVMGHTDWLVDGYLVIKVATLAQICRDWNPRYVGSRWHWASGALRPLRSPSNVEREVHEVVVIVKIATAEEIF